MSCRVDRALSGIISNTKKRSFLKKMTLKWFLPFLFLVVGFPLGLAGMGMGSLARAEEFRYPETLFKDGKARFFDYKNKDGVTIRYFILKSSDGIIRAAFDACDVCWPEGRGYAQKGDFMVCRNCGRKFRSTRVNEVYGGCNPAPLTRKVQKGEVIILSENLLEGKKYFNLKGGKR